MDNKFRHQTANIYTDIELFYKDNLETILL